MFRLCLFTSACWEMRKEIHPVETKQTLLYSTYTIFSPVTCLSIVVIPMSCFGAHHVKDNHLSVTIAVKVSVAEGLSQC